MENIHIFFCFLALAIIYYVYSSSTIYTATASATVSDVNCFGVKNRCNYKYNYSVDGKSYVGKIIRGLKPSSSIQIKYNPKNPEESILKSKILS